MKFVFQFIFLTSYFYFAIADCRPGEYLFNYRCYRFVNSPRTFDDSEIYCRSLGYHLVSIHNAFENAYVQNISKYEFELSDAYFRIGLNTSDDVTWQWTDQTKFDWWNWSPGEPPFDGDRCASMIIADGRWRAYPCSIAQNFVCAGNSSGTGTTWQPIQTSQIPFTSSPVRPSTVQPTSQPLPTPSSSPPTKDPCSSGSQILAIVYEVNRSPQFEQVSNATRNFILNYLVSQNHTSSLMLWGRNLSIVGFPNDGSNFNSKGDFGQINGKASLLVAMDFQWLAVNGTTSDILSGLNYLETELDWRNAASDTSISRTILIIADSVQGVGNAVGKANSMKSAGATIVTLAMISRESFTLNALATSSEYSLSMNYYSSPDYEYTISRELDGLIAQLASLCR